MPNSWITALSETVAVLALTLPSAANAQKPQPEPSTYFEFGTVTALGSHNVNLEVYDEKRQKSVRHTFLLTRDTRADLVHINDAIEVTSTWISGLAA